MKTQAITFIAALLIIEMTASLAIAGGSSTVGPPGPMGRAQVFFNQDASVIEETDRLTREGYASQESNVGETVFVKHENCRSPSADATYTVCDYVFQINRKFARPGQPERILRRTVKVLANGGGLVVSETEPVRPQPEQRASLRSAPVSADGQIFESLAATQEPLDAGLGSEVFRKTVGGLVCVRMIIITPNARPQYRCRLHANRIDAEQIYKALSMPEVAADQVLGAETLFKTVGGLRCEKTTVISSSNQTTYACAYTEASPAN